MRMICLMICTILSLSCAALAGETLVIPGTGDSQTLLQTLARAYETGHPGTSIDIPESIGSSGGIKNVLSGKTVLARVARPLKAEEAKAGLAYRCFALSPVVFAAHLSSPCLSDLNSDQVVGIFSGKIGDWGVLGSCPAHTIYVANREPDDSSRSAIESFLPAFKAIGEPAGKTVYSTPETVQILEQYPHTLGYVPLAALNGRVITPLSFNGTTPTQENVQEGRYPLVIPLGLVWKGDLSPLARQFIAYLFSPEGQGVIRKAGLVPAKAPR